MNQVVVNKLQMRNAIIKRLLLLYFSLALSQTDQNTHALVN